MNNKNKVGVVISRFQTPELHHAHNWLLDMAVNKSETVVVFLGSHPIPSTKRNPLDFQTRKYMVEEYFKEVGQENYYIFEIKDHPSDHVWSKRIDDSLLSLFPDKKITLYDGRDGFSRYYHGTLNVEVLDIKNADDISATKLRNLVKPLPSKDFREGMIYSANLAYHKISAATDIVCWKKVDNDVLILLGQKRHSPGVLRFPGGMVDLKDDSYKSGAQRELLEETDILVSIENFEYIGDFKVNDWRGCDSNQYFTTFYAAKYESGKPASKDDLVNVGWNTVESLNKNTDILAPEHRKLYSAFTTWIKKNNI